MTPITMAERFHFLGLVNWLTAMSDSAHPDEVAPYTRRRVRRSCSRAGLAKCRRGRWRVTAKGKRYLKEEGR
jgi:hypothetical protein